MSKEAFTKICLELGSDACQRGDYHLTYALFNSGSNRAGFLEPTALAASLEKIAAVYAGEKRYRKAVDYYQKALAIYKDAPSTNSGKISSVLDQLAELACQQNKFAKAAQLYEQAMKIDERLGRLNLEAARNRVVRLTWLQLRQGNLEQARDWLKSPE